MQPASRTETCLTAAHRKHWKEEVRVHVRLWRRRREGNQLCELRAKAVGPLGAIGGYL